MKDIYIVILRQLYKLEIACGSFTLTWNLMWPTHYELHCLDLPFISSNNFSVYKKSWHSNIVLRQCPFSILQDSSKYCLRVKSISLPVCVNEVLSEHSHVHLLVVCGCFISYCRVAQLQQNGQQTGPLWKKFASPWPR